VAGGVAEGAGVVTSSGRRGQEADIYRGKAPRGKSPRKKALCGKSPRKKALCGKSPRDLTPTRPRRPSDLEAGPMLGKKRNNLEGKRCR
jgi:hypothetical protein